MTVRPFGPGDLEWAEGLVAAEVGGRWQARRGELVDALDTTNDNLGALAFYQRLGFRLSALRPTVVDASRATLKPQIPATGEDDLPIRDELELTHPL